MSILSVVVLLLLLLVAYFHWIQGLVTATLSAISAVVATLLAFSTYEPIVAHFGPGKFADSAQAMVLIGVFAVTYIVLRIVFDLLIPGNVRFPSLVDKIGAAVMGVIAAILALGLIVVAGQTMPFGPSIAGYSRYAIRDDQPVVVKTSENQNSDRHVYDQITKPRIEGPDATPQQSMILPVDDWVIGFVNFSSNAAMSGSQPWMRIHPNYLQELFGNRIGIEPGAKRSANPVQNKDVVSVLGVYKVDSIPQVQSEYASVAKLQSDDPLPKVLKPDADKTLLVVRMLFSRDATDADNITRVSLGAVRLVAQVNGEFHDYYPVGTVEAGRTLMAASADEPLFVKSDKAADFLFEVPTAALPDTTALPAQIPGDSDLFVEAKRYGRVSLAGKQIGPLTPSNDVELMRKKYVAAANQFDPEAMKQKLVGQWSTSSNGQAVLVTFNADGTFQTGLQSGDNTMKISGHWTAKSAGPEGLTISRTLDTGSTLPDAVVTFQPNNPNAASLKDSTQTLELVRR